jgi:hypothetical protein
MAAASYRYHLVRDLEPQLPRGVEAREIRDWRKANKAVAFLAHQ